MTPTIFLILSLLGCISTAQTSPKILLIRQDLRQIMVEVVRAEIIPYLPTISNSPGPISQVEEQLSGIRRDLDDYRRKTEQLIQSYKESLEQAERLSSQETNGQVQGDCTSGASLENVTFPQGCLRLSTDLETIKEKLEIIQASLIPGNESSTEASFSTKTSAAPDPFTPVSTTPHDGLMTTPNPTVVGNEELSPDEFEAIIRSKPSPSEGNSYNGTSDYDISEEAASRGHDGSHITVEFVNYLNHTLTDFELYDQYSNAFHYAPKSIPPNTKEIFTFIKPSWGFLYEMAFSYSIPNNNVRLAFIVDLEFGYKFHMALVQQNTPMRKYYESQTEFDRFSESRSSRRSASRRRLTVFSSGSTEVAPGDMRHIMVTYSSLQTRATIEMYDRGCAGSVKIELIQVV